MKEFDNLKSSYISAIQWGLTAEVNVNELKSVNETIHKILESYIDNNYTNADKVTLKHDLELIKEALSSEIESFNKKIKSS